jgi:hypothetical protein
LYFFLGSAPKQKVKSQSLLLKDSVLDTWVAAQGEEGDTEEPAYVTPHIIGGPKWIGLHLL